MFGFVQLLRTFEDPPLETLGYGTVEDLRVVGLHRAHVGTCYHTDPAIAVAGMAVVDLDQLVEDL